MRRWGFLAETRDFAFEVSAVDLTLHSLGIGDVLLHLGLARMEIVGFTKFMLPYFQNLSIL